MVVEAGRSGGRFRRWSGTEQSVVWGGSVGYKKETQRARGSVGRELLTVTGAVGRLQQEWEDKSRDV